MKQKIPRNRTNPGPRTKKTDRYWAKEALKSMRETGKGTYTLPYDIRLSTGYFSAKRGDTIEFTPFDWNKFNDGTGSQVVLGAHKGRVKLFSWYEAGRFRWYSLTGKGFYFSQVKPLAFVTLSG